MKNNEEESISRQSDQILLYFQDRFQQLIIEDRMEDAIAIGDEFLEWIKGDDDTVYLYYNENELHQ